MSDWLSSTHILNQSLTDWTLALLMSAVLYLALLALLRSARTRLAASGQRHPEGLAPLFTQTLARTRHWVLLALSGVAGLGQLSWSAWTQGKLQLLLWLLLGFQLALWLSRLLADGLQRLAHRDENAHHAVIFGLLGWLGQLLVWSLMLLAVLANAGVNVTAFVASLGVGGMAVALAAQSLLADLLASIGIGLDRPFEEGDFIAFGAQSGTVLRVGVKSTRIRALSGEELSVPNTMLSQQLVQNYSRMQERRVAFGLRVAQDTPHERIAQIVQEVSALIQSQDKARLATAHMTGFGESSIDFEFVYHVLDPAFASYRDVQQRINLDILALLNRLDVRLAVPVRQMRDATLTP